MTKRELRQRLLTIRQSMSEMERLERSSALCRHLRTWVESQGIGQLTLFAPIRGEPDLAGLHELQGQVVLALPVIDASTGGMVFYQWRQGDVLILNRWGIPEPDPRVAPTLDFDAGKTAILVPALALDRQGGRLGYGGGYYDRFLAAARGVETVGIAFDAFVLEALPRETHDVSVGWLATESGVMSVRRMI